MSAAGRRAGTGSGTLARLAPVAFGALLVVAAVGGGLAVGTAAAATDFEVSVQSPSQVQAGETATLTYTVENTGDEPLESLGLRPTVASGGATVTGASSPDALGVTDDNEVLFETVQPGESVTATVRVSVDAGTTTDQTVEATVVNGFGDGERSKESSTSVAVAPASDDGSVNVDAPRAVQTGANATILVESENTGRLSVTGDTGNWTVLDTDPASLTTSPNPSEMPYESQDGDVWGHVYLSYAAHEFEIQVTAPNETGTYRFTAEADTNASTPTTTFTVRVTESVERHPSGVPQPVFDAVAGSDGSLGRPDVLAAVTAYVNEKGVDGVSLERSEVLALVRFYVQNR